MHSRTSASGVRADVSSLHSCNFRTEIQTKMGDDSISLSTAIDSSNIGFQLLKKCGWKEGTGLGVAEQGQLEPLQPQLKNNKRGLGAEKIKKNTTNLHDNPAFKGKNENHDQWQAKKKAKVSAKRMRKIQEEDKRMQDKEFEIAFFREFWPENV